MGAAVVIGATDYLSVGSSPQEFGLHQIEIEGVE